MRKVILTAPNGKVYITKTKYPLNDTFHSLAPSIKDSNKYFSERDLKFIKEELIGRKHLNVTAIDGLQFIAQGATIYSVPMDGRKKEAKNYEYFCWDKAYQFAKDNNVPAPTRTFNPRGITEIQVI